jgi:uncharacterized membrane protein
MTMTNTITRTYDSFAHARTVVKELKAAGLQNDDISVIAHDDHADLDGITAKTPDVEDNSVANGAGIGGVVGGAAGLLAGLGLMAIPGVGPLVAAGWLATTAAGIATGALAGAATGGIVSAMTESGMSQDEAETYAEAVRRGAILISVKADDDMEQRVIAIMDRHSPSDLAARRSSWESEGWSSHDPAAQPYDREQRQREMARWS